MNTVQIIITVVSVVIEMVFLYQVPFHIYIFEHLCLAFYRMVQLVESTRLHNSQLLTHMDTPYLLNLFQFLITYFQKENIFLNLY